MNALNNDLFEALIATAEAIKVDKSVRVVILHGAGKAFCAGLDMDLMKAASDTDMNARTE